MTRLEAYDLVDSFENLCFDLLSVGQKLTEAIANNTDPSAILEEHRRKHRAWRSARAEVLAALTTEE